jgi:hypothetical protein
MEAGAGLDKAAAASDNNDGTTTAGVNNSNSYRDFSRETAKQLDKDDGVQNFPMKLHAILSNPEFQDVVAWLPHGRAWRILQHKAFEERVIPLYFRHGR